MQMIFLIENADDNDCYIIIKDDDNDCYIINNDDEHHDLEDNEHFLGEVNFLSINFRIFYKFRRGCLIFYNFVGEVV